MPAQRSDVEEARVQIVRVVEREAKVHVPEPRNDRVLLEPANGVDVVEATVRIAWPAQCQCSGTRGNERDRTESERSVRGGHRTPKTVEKRGAVQEKSACTE